MDNQNPQNGLGDNSENTENKSPTTGGNKQSCKFFLENKKRYCRMSAKEGEELCVVHFQDPRKIRVPCPLDPRHTTYTYDLKRHLTRCNARKIENPHPSYASELNGGRDSTQSVPSVQLSLREMSGDQLLKFVEKIKFISNTYLPEASFEIGAGSCKELEEEIESSLNGNEAKRHLRQTSSILRLLETMNSMAPNTCFIEFGSGKGGLTYWIAQATRSLAQPETQSFVLIDKSSPRHKKDNKLQGPDCKVERIRIDIKDLRLDHVKFVIESQHLVGMSKHLCGNATDMALTCLLDTNSLRKKVSGFVFATCCHHQCTWNDFVGKSSFLNWGFTLADFKPIIGITSWYVCGTGTQKFPDSSEDVPSLKYSKLGLDFETRREIGWKAKRLLDYARCEFIKSKGFDARFSTFASSDDTFENVCIVGSASSTCAEGCGVSLFGESSCGESSCGEISCGESKTPN